MEGLIILESERYWREGRGVGGLGRRGGRGSSYMWVVDLHS